MARDALVAAVFDEVVARAGAFSRGQSGVSVSRNARALAKRASGSFESDLSTARTRSRSRSWRDGVERDRRLTFHRAHDLRRRLSLERATTGERIVERDARGEDVHAHVGRFAARLLGCHVRRRAHRDSDARARESPIVIERTRETEVEHLDEVVRQVRLAHENVFGLHVAMHDARVVRGGERREDLRHDRHGARGLELPGFLHERGQRRTAQKLHHEKRGILVHEIENLHDVRMREAGRGERLLFEAKDVVGLRRREHLHRDAPAQIGLLRFVDFSHPSLAEQREDFVATRERSSDERHGITAGPTWLRR